MLAPPTRTASSIGRRAPSATTLLISSGTAWSANLKRLTSVCPPESGSTTWASPATPVRRSSSARPMQEPRPSVTSVSPAVREAASSPIRTIVSVMTRRGVPAAAPAPPSSGTSRKTIEQPSPSTTMLESSSSDESLNAARVARTACDQRREHVGRGRRRRRLELDPGHAGERVEVGRPDDVADLAQRRLGVLRVRAAARAARTAPRRPAGSAASARSTACRPSTPSAMPVISDSGGPIASTASCIGTSRASGTRQVDRAPEHAREGGRGVAGADVRELSQGVELDVVVGRAHATAPRARV